MKRIVLLLAVVTAASCFADEVDVKDACQLKSASDKVFTVKVTSGEDACKGRRCFAGIYRGSVVAGSGAGAEDGQEVVFTTSAEIQIGESYLLFANAIKPGERSITFLGPGEETSYVVPESVQYYVPIEGAFLSTGRGHFRTVVHGCVGDGPECRVINAVDDKAVLKADVIYPDLLGALKACKANKGK